MVLKTKGRPSTSFVEQEFANKAKKGPVKPIPSAPVRKDQIGHFPEFGKKGRCKMPECKGITKISCIKCKINLCFTAKNNCFLLFHSC